MSEEHLERAAKAVYETDPVGERAWEDAPLDTRRRCFVIACAVIEAWDYGGATLLSDFPTDTSSIEIVTNEDGSVGFRRKPQPDHGGATLSEADCRMIAKEVGSIAERRLVVHGPQPDHS